MNICIIGAGNMGLAITAYLANKGSYNVCLYTGKEILKNGPLKMVDTEAEELIMTENFRVEKSLQKATKSADFILCTYPAFLRQRFVEAVSPFLQAGVRLGFIPGYGGVEYSCTDLIDRGIVVFGLQRVPYVARARSLATGMEVNILSKKRVLHAAAIPNSYTENICFEISKMLDIQCTALKEYLAITLAPSNPLLHTCGLFTMFEDYKPGIYYSKEYPFYQQWNDDTSKLLLKYDDELQEICHNLSPMNLEEVVSLKKYYEAPTFEAMTRKLKSIPSFEAVMMPMKEEKEGYIPDLESRMFVEDFPFGVCIMKSFGLLTQTKTPVVDMLLDFYRKLTGKCYFYTDGSLGPDGKDTGVPFLFGLNNKDQIIQFYHR